MGNILPVQAPTLSHCPLLNSQTIIHVFRKKSLHDDMCEFLIAWCICHNRGLESSKIKFNLGMEDYCSHSWYGWRSLNSHHGLCRLHFWVNMVVLSKQCTCSFTATIVVILRAESSSSSHVHVLAYAGINSNSIVIPFSWPKPLNLQPNRRLIPISKV